GMRFTARRMNAYLLCIPAGPPPGAPGLGRRHAVYPGSQGHECLPFTGLPSLSPCVPPAPPTPHTCGCGVCGHTTSADVNAAEHLARHFGDRELALLPVQ